MPWIADDFDFRGGAYGSAVVGISAYEVAAYQTASATPPGEQTTAEQAVVAAVEAKLSAISLGWNVDQRAIDAEILARCAALQKEMANVIRQYALPRQSGPQSEMFSVVTGAMLDRDRLLLELRERLDASPY